MSTKRWSFRFAPSSSPYASNGLLIAIRQVIPRARILNRALMKFRLYGGNDPSESRKRLSQQRQGNFVIKWRPCKQGPWAGAERAGAQSWAVGNRCPNDAHFRHRSRAFSRVAWMVFVIFCTVSSYPAISEEVIHRGATVALPEGDGVKTGWRASASVLSTTAVGAIREACNNKHEEWGGEGQVVIEIDWNRAESSVDSHGRTVANLPYSCAARSTYVDDEGNTGYTYHHGKVPFNAYFDVCGCGYQIVAGSPYCERIPHEPYWEFNRKLGVARLHRTPELCQVDDIPYQPCSDSTSAAGSGSSGLGGSASSLVGNPISCITGAKVQQETDYFAPDGLSLVRTYSSRRVRESVRDRNLYPHRDDPSAQTLPNRFSETEAGWNWSLDYQVEHVNVGMEWGERNFRAVKLHFPSNRVDAFVTDDYRGSSAPSEYRNAEGEVLTYYPETRSYRYEMADGRVLVIHASDGLRSMDEPNGSSWTVEGNIRRQEITDELGRSMVYERAWIRGGYRVVAVTTPEGYVFRYQYDTLGNLITVIYPDETINNSSDNPRRQYLFEDPDNPRNITGIIDENGERHATYAYDNEGRAVLSKHAGGAGQVALRYLGDRQTEVTYQVDAERDTTLLYEHDLFDGRGRVTRIERRACESCAPEDAHFSYDANGHLAKKVDYNGVTSLYTHDERGLELGRVEAFGTVNERSSSIEWHPEFRRPTVIHDTAQSRHLSYDAAGNLSEIRVVDRATGASQVNGYSHNSYGQVTDIDGPRTDVPDRTRFEYDGQGNQMRVINALYQTTEITNHDAAGRPVRLVDPNGVVTELDYDARGRLIRQQTGGAVTFFERDGVGQLTRLTLPDGTNLSYEYDAAHRLIAIEATDGERIEFQHDAMGNVTTERIHDVGGQLVKRHTQVFDELGRLLEQTSADGGVRRYGYDVNSNRVSTLDERSNETQRAYDALERVSEVIDPALGETHYTYNSLDQISSVTDPEGLTTHYRYDGLGNLVEVTSPDTGVTTHEYDAAGNRTRTIDARGVLTEYDYDALNRLTAARYPNAPAENVSYHYDSEEPGRNGIGRLTRVDDPSGAIRYFYNPLGNVTRKETTLNGHTLTVEYRYDNAGQLTGITYPSGQQLTLTRDTQGRLSGLHTRLNGQSSDHGLAQAIEYLPFGPLSRLTYGNGLQELRTHDLDYRLTGIELRDSGPLRRRLYEYDAANNITRIEDPAETGNAIDYAYDPVNRLVEAISTRYDIQLGYDLVGNRTDKTIDGIAENYQYATDSHHLLSNGTQHYQYDAVGNTIDNGTYQFEYSAANRMVRASRSGSTMADYTYNSLGQRVIKALPDGTVIHYLFNEQGQLLGEYDSAGNVIREYVYLEGAPLAMVSGNLVYYYHNDHLGTPRLLTDAQKAVVWKAAYTPFGEADVQVEQVTNNIRYPGQYFDAETGLHYNYFRDYDPETGRYLQSDPIGLDGGLNTYAYVEGNPIVRTDFFGLFPSSDCHTIPSQDGFAPVTICRPGKGIDFNTGEHAAKLPHYSPPDTRTIEEIDCSSCHLNCLMASLFLPGPIIPTSKEELAEFLGWNAASTGICNLACKDRCKKDQCGSGNSLITGF